MLYARFALPVPCLQPNVPTPSPCNRIYLNQKIYLEWLKRFHEGFHTGFHKRFHPIPFLALLLS
jgi:hypothetical protein